MRKLFSIAIIFTIMVATTHAKTHNLGPPIEDDKVTFDQVLEENNFVVSQGWDAVDVQSIRHQELDFFMSIKYVRDQTIFVEELVVFTKTISDYSRFSFLDLKMTILSQSKRKPDPGDRIKAEKCRTQAPTIHLGSAGGLPYTYAIRVAHA